MTNQAAPRKPLSRTTRPEAAAPATMANGITPNASSSARGSNGDGVVVTAPVKRDEPGVEALLERVFLTPRVVDQRAIDELSGSLKTLVREAGVQNKALATTTVEVKALSEQLRGASRELQTHLQAAAKSPMRPGTKALIDPEQLDAVIAKRVQETVQAAVESAVQTAVQTAVEAMLAQSLRPAVEAAVATAVKPSVDECVHAAVTNTTDQMLLALRADAQAREERTVAAAKAVAIEVAREAAQDGLTTALVGLPPGPDLMVIQEAEAKVVSTLERVLKAQQMLAESADVVEARLATSTASAEGLFTRFRGAAEEIESRVGAVAGRAEELLARAGSAQAAIDHAADTGVLRVASLAEQTQAAAARVESLLAGFDEGVLASEVRAGAAASRLEERIAQSERQAISIHETAGECTMRLGAAIAELERRAGTVSMGLEAALADFSRRERELSAQHEEKTLNTTFAAASRLELAADEFAGTLAGVRDMHERAAKGVTQEAAGRLDAAVADFARRVRELDVRAMSRAIGEAEKAAENVLDAARRAQASAVGAEEAAARCESIVGQTEMARSQLSQTLLNGAIAADALAARVDKAHADHEAWVAKATTPLSEAAESIGTLERVLPIARRVGDGLARLVSQADAVGEGLDKLMRKAGGKGGQGRG